MVKPKYLLFVSEEEYNLIQKGLSNTAVLGKVIPQRVTPEIVKQIADLQGKLRRAYDYQKPQIDALAEYKGNTADLPEQEI